MCNHTFLNLQIPDQRSGHTESGLSAWWLYMVTLIFLMGLCGYVWVNILTLSPLRVISVGTFTFFIAINFTRQTLHSFHITVLRQRDKPWSWLLTLKVLNFWKFTSYCSLKPLWSGMGEVVPARTSPTLHPPSPPTVHQLSQLAL